MSAQQQQQQQNQPTEVEEAATTTERAEIRAHWPAVPPDFLAANESAIARFDARTTLEEKLEKLEDKEGKVPQPERIRSSPEATWYLTPHLEGKVQKGSDNDHSRHRKKHPQWTRPKSKRSTPISK